MNRVPDDSELLELIEGGLTPAREREVRALMAADADLARRVSQMMMQRSMLHQLGERDERPTRDLAGAAVSGVVNEEMRRMVERAGTVRSGGPGSRRPSFAMLAAAGLGLVLVGGWVWFLVGRVGPGGSLTQPRNFTPKYRDIVREPTPSTPEARDVMLPVPDAIDRVAATALERGDTLLPDFVGPLAEGQRVEFEHTPATLAKSDDLLDQWLAKLGPGEAPAVTLDRAVELARAGKLRIIVTGTDAGLLRDRVVRLAESKGGFMPGEVAAASEESEGAEPPGLARSRRGGLALALPMGMEPRLVREAIEALSASVTASGAGTLRFDEVPPMETITEDLSAADLLWWSRPSDQWRTRPIVRVPVVIEAAVLEPAPVEPTPIEPRK